jgi:translation initiation factor IF-1
MLNDDKIEVSGSVIELLPGYRFKVELPNGHAVLAHISGQLRRNFVRIAVGDTVDLQLSPFDLDKGRIVMRAGAVG